MSKRGMITRPEAVWDAWAVTELADGSTRPATRVELLQRGVVELARADGVVHVLVTAIDSSPDGRRHAALDLPAGAPVEPASAIASRRWREMERRAPGAWRRAARVEVARNADGSNLEAELAAERRAPGPERGARARALVRDREHPAERRRIRLADVQPGDVVLELLPPVRIQGEAR